MFDHLRALKDCDCRRCDAWRLGLLAVALVIIGVAVSL